MKKLIILLLLTSCSSELMEHEIIYETKYDTIKRIDSINVSIYDTIFNKVFDTIRINEVIYDTTKVTIYDTIKVYDTITRKIKIRFLAENETEQTAGTQYIYLTDKEHLIFDDKCIREIIFELE